MADDLKLTHGEPLWDAKYNRLVDTVERMGGIVNNLHWTKESSEGIVLLNGFTGQLVYSYLDFGGQKLVSLYGALKGDLKKSELKEVATIPDVIRVSNRMVQGKYWGDTIWLVDNKLSVMSDADQSKPDNSWNVVFNFTYKA